MRAHPTGTVTFLFTDIEGSTRLWEERPDEMRAALRHHDDSLRIAIEAHDGYVFATGGDGFAAAFGRAAEAVATAEAAQAAIDGDELIRVRMGINTGEAQERDGDYFGPAVNRAARLMAAGHGGQVLIAAVTAQLVPGLVLRNLGEHRLPDLGNPMLIWQLGTHTFPPLRTLDELPGNLPVQRTSFIGRADEVKQVAALVANERLVTLTGLGGVGKSRLALQVAAELAPTYPDGVWFASLSALEEGALVPAALIEALGVPERRGESTLDTLCAWSKARHALLLIDNCEHLIEDVAVVVDCVLDASSSVSVLATSQTPLGVRGEHARSVAPLAGGDVAFDSVELFVDRARMARADFELSTENERSVAEICERLDHVPLAIELAAARVRGMAPADIARRLDQRLRLLTSTDRMAPGRHRTLDAAVRWSYELLDETQRRVFDRLSVFAGPFTIDAAEVVVAGDGVEEFAVLDGVLALVDKSLVVVDETSGDSRYRLLETMRQFGQANLVAAGAGETYRDRHAAYYANFVIGREPKLHGADVIEALDELEREFDNVRLTLRRAADDRTSSRFELVMSTLHTFWMYRGRSAEGASWASELRDRSDVDPAARIIALGFGAQVMHSYDVNVAQEMAEMAEALWMSTDAALPLMAIGAMTLGALMQGRNLDAITGCERVLSLVERETDLYLRGHVLGNCYAVLALCGGAFDQLAVIRDDAIAIAEQLDNGVLRASIASSTATIIHLTDPQQAGDHLRRTFQLNDELRNHLANSAVAMFIALHEVRAGARVPAARWARRSLDLALDYSPTYITQAMNAVVATLKRDSPAESLVLLGAMRSHRLRRRQAGTRAETESEARFEASVRRRIDSGAADERYAAGLAMDESSMIALAREELDAIIEAGG